MTSPKASIDESAGLKHARCDTPDITGECGILANSPIRVPGMSRDDQQALLDMFSAAEAEEFSELKESLGDGADSDEDDPVFNEDDAPDDDADDKNKSETDVVFDQAKAFQFTSPLAAAGNIIAASGPSPAELSRPTRTTEVPPGSSAVKGTLRAPRRARIDYHAPCNFIAEVDAFRADDPNVKVLIDGYRQDKIKFTTGAVVPISSAGDWESYVDYICTGRKFGD